MAPQFPGPQKQPIAAISTSEAEYYAADQAVRKALWLEPTIQESTPHLPRIPSTINIDSRSVIKVAETRSKTKMTKHIDIRKYHIQDCLKRKRIQLKHIASQDNPADQLTKKILQRRIATGTTDTSKPTLQRLIMRHGVAWTPCYRT